ncbi:putative major facilitator superfamily transporter protein [Diplogelasinospora grovesii]|uniref:Major facilitator superfamily transporter protein n=1 Tax=Diplogelasinospora grovesii TaxID=303347 RepID=A0AAN6NGR8_9PEZI|nr:putative major facilitator superfamily transporter protein [Diplogelasinospora grovesii]
MEKDTINPYTSDSDRIDAKDIEAGTIAPLPATTSGKPESEAPAGPAAPDAGPVPDGGLDAWLQVLGSTIILAETWGLINSFGVFQAYYQTDLLAATSSSSDISWIGSLQGSLLMLVGVISGPLFDAGYFRHLLWAGMFLIVFGQFMTSLCSSYWQVVLAQGVCIGIGMGFTFLPSAAIMSQYFSKRRALALGIASAGSPVAGIVFPIIFSGLQPSIGFGWATRVIAFILLALAIIPLACMHTRIPPNKKRALIDKSALRELPFLTFISGGFLAFLTLYVPFFYISIFSTSHQISADYFAPYLVTLLNVGSVFGRIVPNWLADSYGSLNMLIICTFVSAILAFAWLGIHNLGGLCVFALLYGTFSGGLVSLNPSVIVTLSPDMGRVGARMGMSFLATGISILIGTPIAGAILGEFTEAEWMGTMGYAAAGMLLATAMYGTSRFLIYKKNGHWRA